MIELFENVPHTDDPRQELFLEWIKRERASMDDSDDLDVIPMRGFPASSPDLGWLQDQIESYWKAGHCEDIRALQVAISERIGHVVQRCKEWASTVSDRQFLDVRFETKDDHGYYLYQFGCKLYDTHPVNAPIGEGVKVIEDE